MWIKKKEWEEVKNKLDRLYSGHVFDGFYNPIGEVIDCEDFKVQMNQYHLILRHKNESTSTNTISDQKLEDSIKKRTNKKNFVFHEGDYVEVSDGTKGYVTKVANETPIVLLWKITEKGNEIHAPKVGSVIAVYANELHFAQNNKYWRIGKYDFQSCIPPISFLKTEGED